jgi:predicted nucleic acid-binding protein
MYSRLRKLSKGISNASLFIIPNARSEMIQVMTAVDLFGLALLNITPEIVRSTWSTPDLQTKGIRAADAIHIATAAAYDADLFVSADFRVTALDGVLHNSSGHSMRCIDSDVALTVV